MKLRGRIAVITGASRGIGKAIAIALAKEGCAVGLMARSEEALSETAKACREFGSSVFALPIDLGSPLAAAEGLKLLVRELGGLDILINNAGTGGSGSIEELELEDQVTSFKKRNIYLEDLVSWLRGESEISIEWDSFFLK